MIRFRALYAWVQKQEIRQALTERRLARVITCPLFADEIGARPAGRLRFLSVEEAQRLIAECTGPLLTFVGLGLFAGLRLRETLTLQPADIARDPVSVSVHEKPHWIKGRKPWKPKTKKPRTIPCGEWLGRVVLDHLGACGEALWLFPSRYIPDQPLDPSTIHREMRVAVERAGMVWGMRGEGVTYHTLRHTFAAHAIMAGADIFTVAKLMGHSDVRMIQSTYGHLSPDHTRAAMAKVEGRLVTTNPPQKGQ
jgi:integrase